MGATAMTGNEKEQQSKIKTMQFKKKTTQSLLLKNTRNSFQKQNEHKFTRGSITFEIITQTQWTCAIEYPVK